jgi:hypothetical protein
MISGEINESRDNLHIISPLISFTLKCSFDFLRRITLREAHKSMRTPKAKGISQYRGDKRNDPPNTT